MVIITAMTAKNEPAPDSVPISGQLVVVSGTMNYLNKRENTLVSNNLSDVTYRLILNHFINYHRVVIELFVVC